MTAHSSTLAEIVADTLRQALRDGVYVCGEKLPEIRIAQEMNVSQNTARDALRILEQEGWVVRRPRYGISVKSFTIKEAQELCALRIALEDMALGWALDRMNESGIQQLWHTLDGIYLQMELGNERGMQEAVITLHQTVVTLADRPQTAQFLLIIHNQVRMLQNIRLIHQPGGHISARRLVDDYRQLLEYIATSQRSAAQAALREIITAERDILLSILDSMT
jgi:DNA-binding GntR family transcriptional regulator